MWYSNTFIDFKYKYRIQLIITDCMKKLFLTLNSTQLIVVNSDYTTLNVSVY